MTTEQIERDFRNWADPDAATRSSKGKVRVGELGGHGNGGKCYLTQMFQDHAMLYTARNARGSKYGVRGGSVVFGYVPNRRFGRSFRVDDVPRAVENALSNIGISADSLPKMVRETLRTASGFTFVCGVQPKDWVGRKVVENLLQNLVVHHQMTTPIQLCSVYVVINGRLHNDGKPLRPPSIEPMPDHSQPRTLPVPAKLTDPVSRQTVYTTTEGQSETGRLEIRTSEKNMRLGRGGPRQWRHTLDFHTNRSGIIGRTSMLKLDVESSYRDYLYCDCYLDGLDPYQQNERRDLAESPLTRAVESWISGQVRAYCRELEAAEKQKIRAQDRDQLSRINEWLDQWKNQFMSELMQGFYGPGEDEAPRRTRLLPTGTPASVQIVCTNDLAGVGVYFRPKVKFFDAQGRRIRPVPYKWLSTDNNVAMADEDLMQIQTFSPGQTRLSAMTMDGKLKSNEIPLEVVQIQEIRVVPQEVTLQAGSRCRLEAICTLAKGAEATGVNLTWLEDDSSVARVSSSGMVYGASIGQTKVTAVDDSCKSDVPALVRVTAGKDSGRGEHRGKAKPIILVSEIDTAPEDEEPAVFRQDEPPVMQRVRDVERNIWWINLASPFARLYFNDSRYGVESEAWRMYHIERYIDIIVEICLANAPDSDETLDFDTWVFRSGEIEADIRKRAIESLVPFIKTGELSYR